MRFKMLLILFSLSLLAACNLPTTPVATPTGDAVSTQVSQLLTAAPTATTAKTEPAKAPSPTLAPPTPTNAPTAGPSATPRPSPTTPSGDPKNSLGTPTWTDSLETGKGFYLYENDNTRVTAENGALVLTGIQSNGWLGWSMTFSHPAQNFYLEGTFEPQACSGDDMYGLVFRAPSTDAGYFFGVTCGGKYNLHARDFAANTDTSLIQLTANGAIQSGPNSTNRLGVLANGNTLGLYANGVLLQEISDSAFTNEGDFGALVAANETAGFTVKMTDISLWKLP